MSRPFARCAAIAIALSSALALSSFAQDKTWKNWDQSKAFAEAQARVAKGKDPMPGVRNCFWRYGPTSGDPYLNIAYPDAGTFYWGAAFTIPDGAKLELEGQFPRARYMSLISYDQKGAPIEAVADYLFVPSPGSINPFLDGADRTSKKRAYKIEVSSAPLETPMRWGVYLAGETRTQIHAPQLAGSTQQQIQYRIYTPDRGTDETANAGLPVAALTLTDGRVLRGPAACEALNTEQPNQADVSALALPRPELDKLLAAAKERLGPAGPAALPPAWLKSTEETSRFAIYTGDLSTEAGARKRSGSFYANLDNQYLRAFISRKFGEVFVLRAKAPTTPKSYTGTKIWRNDAELRYWSWCSNQGFGTARVNACVFDEQISVDKNGFYTLVVSREADRPRNAIPECGVAWLPMADIGDGTGEEDLTLLTLRQMLGAGDFKYALAKNKVQANLAEDLGPYMPKAQYTSVAAFETFRPCLLEKR